MKHSKSFRVISAGIALAMAGAALAGCEAKPGVAAYGDGLVITEQQVGAVSSELTKTGFRTEHPIALLYLLTLDYGGKQILSECPKISDIKAKDFQVDTTNLSPETRDVIQLMICAIATNSFQAENLGIEPVSPEVAQQINEASKKAQEFVTSTGKVSPRIRMGISTLQRSSQQQATMPQ